MGKTPLFALLTRASWQLAIPDFRRSGSRRCMSSCASKIRCAAQGLVLCVVCLATPAAAVAAADVKAARQLAEPVSITWQDVPLTTALARLKETQSLATWLDRRIDPSAPITLSVVDQPLGEVLATLASQVGATTTSLGGLIYLGPQQTADEIATLAALARQPLAKAPPAMRGPWLKAQPWAFAKLSQPRTLLNDLVASAGAKVEDEQLVPHDLWPARETPALAPIDRAVLLLAGFDLTCELSSDGGAIRVVPIQRPVVIAEVYRVAKSRQSAFDAALGELAGATQSGDENRPTISARVEDHQRLRAALSGRRTGAVAAAAALRSAGAKAGGSTLEDRRFTLTIANKPLEPVLNQLASQLNLQLVWDDSLPPGAADRAALVSCQVDRADLDKLLKSLLTPAGLDFARQENRVTIRRQ